jgi:hypothetical protein
MMGARLLLIPKKTLQPQSGRRQYPKPPRQVQPLTQQFNLKGPDFHPALFKAVCLFLLYTGIGA